MTLNGVLRQRVSRFLLQCVVRRLVVNTQAQTPQPPKPLNSSLLCLYVCAYAHVGMANKTNIDYYRRWTTWLGKFFYLSLFARENYKNLRTLFKDYEYVMFMPQCVDYCC